MRLSPIFDPVSPQAAAMERVSTVGFVVSAFIFAGVTLWIALALIRYRARPGSPELEKIAFGNHRIEIAWTLVPVLIVAYLFIVTAQGMRLSDPTVTRAPDVIVTGHQWWWEIQYPRSGVVAANEMHIPVGQKLYIRLESADVIHDFWAPQLGRKMDMIPGHPNAIWIEADRPGTFQGSCGEYCGNQHAWMRFTVYADSPQDFARWEQAQLRPVAATAAGPALAGRRLFTTLTCVNCHALKGTGASARYAPDLTHFASRSTFGAGVSPNTADALTRWLRNPQDIKPGCLMPNFQLQPDQVANLVAYLETLR